MALLELNMPQAIKKSSHVSMKCNYEIIENLTLNWFYQLIYIKMSTRCSNVLWKTARWMQHLQTHFDMHGLEAKSCITNPHTRIYCLATASKRSIFIHTVYLHVYIYNKSWGNAGINSNQEMKMSGKMKCKPVGMSYPQIASININLCSVVPMLQDISADTLATTPRDKRCFR